MTKNNSSFCKELSAAVTWVFPSNNVSFVSFTFIHSTEYTKWSGSPECLWFVGILDGVGLQVVQVPLTLKYKLSEGRSKGCTPHAHMVPSVYNIGKCDLPSLSKVSVSLAVQFIQRERATRGVECALTCLLPIRIGKESESSDVDPFYRDFESNKD